MVAPTEDNETKLDKHCQDKCEQSWSYPAEGKRIEFVTFLCPLRREIALPHRVWF